MWSEAAVKVGVVGLGYLCSRPKGSHRRMLSRVPMPRAIRHEEAPVLLVPPPSLRRRRQPSLRRCTSSKRRISTCLTLC